MPTRDKAFIVMGIVGYLLLAAAASRAGTPPLVQIDEPFTQFCETDDSQAGFVTLHVMLYGASSMPTTGASFRVVPSGGFTGVLVAEDYLGSLYVGNATDGVSVAYGCVDTNSGFEVVRLTYQLFGTSMPCSALQVVPRPGVSSIYVTDCTFNEVPTQTVGPFFFNWSPTCGSLWCFIATEPTTWGKVKALYR
jgi:hypothetical protein